MAQNTDEEDCVGFVFFDIDDEDDYRKTDKRYRADARPYKNKKVFRRYLRKVSPV